MNTFDFTDSFSHYSTFAQLITKWRLGSISGFLSQGGSVGAAFALGSASQGYRANNNGIGVSIPQGASRKFAFKMRFSGVNTNFFWTLDTLGFQILVGLDVTNHITIRRSNTLLATSAGTFALNTIYSVAIELTISSGAGVCNVYINGALAVGFAGNTQQSVNAFINSFYIGCNVGNFDFSDVVVYPFAMTTLMSPSVNPVIVAGAGSLTAFNRGGVDLGTNWQQISKALAAIVNFNFSNVLNDRDNFDMGNVGAGTILGAMMWEYAQKDGNGLRSIRLTLENGASDDVATQVDQALTVGGYAFYGRDASVDPATGANWASLADFNGLKAGYKITV